MPRGFYFAPIRGGSALDGLARGIEAGVSNYARERKATKAAERQARMDERQALEDERRHGFEDTAAAQQEYDWARERGGRMAPRDRTNPAMSMEGRGATALMGGDMIRVGRYDVPSMAAIEEGRARARAEEDREMTAIGGAIAGAQGLDADPGMIGEMLARDLDIGLVTPFDKSEAGRTAAERRALTLLEHELEGDRAREDYARDLGKLQTTHGFNLDEIGARGRRGDAYDLFKDLFGAYDDEGNYMGPDDEKLGGRNPMELIEEIASGRLAPTGDVEHTEANEAVGGPVEGELDPEIVSLAMEALDGLRPSEWERTLLMSGLNERQVQRILNGLRNAGGSDPVSLDPEASTESFVPSRRTPHQIPAPSAPSPPDFDPWSSAPISVPSDSPEDIDRDVPSLMEEVLDLDRRIFANDTLSNEGASPEVRATLGEPIPFPRPGARVEATLGEPIPFPRPGARVEATLGEPVPFPAPSPSKNDRASMAARLDEMKKEAAALDEMAKEAIYGPNWRDMGKWDKVPPLNEKLWAKYQQLAADLRQRLLALQAEYRIP